MKSIILAAVVGLAVAAPAQATGGFVCRTSGARPIQLSVGFGHAAGAPLLQDATRLSDNGRAVAVSAPQWWFDGTELRLLLADPNGMRREAIVKTRRNGQRRWARCREG